MPLRRLFAQIPNLIPVLKPCLMMSPLSVAQFLPADRYQFDVVIFDEASQVRPHDAIGAILRGKQLIVAGDSQQLPPTAFFERSVDDDIIDDDDLRAVPSILDAVRSKGANPRNLRWHYRSRHESLIAYSNHSFYKGRLITFPSAGDSPNLGVRFDYVSNGRYEDERERDFRTTVKINRIEAKRVAQLVLEHARKRPDESIGVVTLGLHQRDVVEEEIKQSLVLDKSLDEFFREDKPDRFFVKALEQVQGDERDVILISVGYGKNALGHLSHNFGPINQEGGERRLNVLVTRARN
jgi:superfamily I DNA and/or RNA helicase